MTQNARRLVFIAVAVALVTASHYLTGLHLHWAHDIYRRLYYLPIIFAGFWFGLRGGLITGVLVSIVFLPHVLFQWQETPWTNAEQFLEMVIYVIVGGVTGLLSQKEAQRREELGAANLQLKEQSVALVKAEELLRRADRLTALGELSAGMAHEIRNPLGSIKGTAEIFRDGLGADHRLHEFAQILVKESDRLDAILGRYLELASPAPADPGRADLKVVLADLLRLTGARARKAKVELVSRVGDGLPAMAIPEDELRQVLVNLLLNAIQALAGGGRVTIDATTGPPRRLRRPDSPGTPQVVELSVTDDGPGVPPEARERIFEPFFTTKPGGTGLGLAISQRIVHGYRGAIAFEPGTPAGARFIIELPIAAAEARE